MMRQKIFDALLEMKSSSTVKTSALATVNGSVVTWDTGGGYTTAALVVDIVSLTEAIQATSNQGICIQVRGRASAASSGVDGEVVLASLDLGYNGVDAHGIGTRKNASVATPAAGDRYVLPFTNEYCDTIYRYINVRHTFDGTISTGINYTAFITKL